MQLSKPYHAVRFKCFKYIVARCYDIFQNKHVFISELSYLTLQIIFDAWWASINVGPKLSIAWNNSRHVHLWRFYLHCGIEKTSSPSIICIVCHQVLCHSSEHGTSSMGKHSLPKAQITNWNASTETEVTQSNSSTVDETVLAIFKREGSSGMTIVSSQSKFIFDIYVSSILAEVTAKTHQTGS